jgi:hypothetical protein
LAIWLLADFAIFSGCYTNAQFSSLFSSRYFKSLRKKKDGHFGNEKALDQFDGLKV